MRSTGPLASVAGGNRRRFPPRRPFNASVRLEWGTQILKQLDDVWRKVAASPHAETASGRTVARFLGVTTSAVNRLAVSPALPTYQKYLKAL